MVDSRTENLAKLCVQYSLDVKPKDKVFIQGNVLAFPLMKELYRECLLGDAYPTIIPSLDVEYIFLGGRLPGPFNTGAGIGLTASGPTL